jgi:hypothetical protein
MVESLLKYCIYIHKFQMRKSYKQTHYDIVTVWPEHQHKLNLSHKDQDKYWK